MKKEKRIKNGFTLIELLAVIIILGILMIIAIPSVTSYINNSRKSAYVDSAREIIAGARNFVNEGKVPMYDTSATYYIKSSCISTENGQKSPYGDFVDDETYVIVTYDGKGYDYYWVSRDTTGQGVSTPIALKDLDEDDIKSDIALGTIIPTKISDDKSNVQVINATCNGFEEQKIDITSFATLPTGKTKKEELVVGDLVTIGTEEFYVINNDTTNDKLTLLAHYNLKVGNICNSSWSKTGEYTSDDDGYGLQSSEAKGWVSGASSFNGTVAFSSTNYWSSSTSSYPTDVYDKDNTNCTIATYVEAYKDYLKNNLKAPIKEARLLKYSEAITLGCNASSYTCSGAQAFVKETSYWLGSARGTDNLWIVHSSGTFFGNGYSGNDVFGVRPVIVI